MNCLNPVSLTFLATLTIMCAPSLATCPSAKFSFTTIFSAHMNMLYSPLIALKVWT